MLLATKFVKMPALSQEPLPCNDSTYSLIKLLKQTKQYLCLIRVIYELSRLIIVDIFQVRY